MQETLLDIIETDVKKFHGIVDYISTKHVTLYDLTDNEDPNVSLAVIIYKLYYSDIRFSIYKAMYFPHYKSEEPVLINRKWIKNSSMILKSTKPDKKITKLPTNQ